MFNLKFKIMRFFTNRPVKIMLPACHGDFKIISRCVERCILYIGCRRATLNGKNSRKNNTT